jgi:hypothetical protein
MKVIQVFIWWDERHLRIVDSANYMLMTYIASYTRFVFKIDG